MDRLASPQPELPSLRSWLQQRSAAERRTLARLWKLDAAEDGAETEALLQGILTPAGVATLLALLRPVDCAALERLQAEGGVLQARILEREFGLVREHRAYPNPRAYLDALASPPSATERLYILGLIQQWRTAEGVAYAIPAELLQLLPPVPPRERQLAVRTVRPDAVHVGNPARIERQLVALLAAAYHEPLPVGRAGELRRLSASRAAGALAAALWPDEDPAEAALSERMAPQLGLLRHLALELGLLRRVRAGLRPSAAAVAWLERSPLERRRGLLQAWINSRWDELTALCGLRWRAEPLRRDPAVPRLALLALLAQLEDGRWFALDEWVSEVRRLEPDYQRPDGNYDAWMLAEPAGESRIGFQHWDAVEGRLARAVMTGPLAWLGLLDLGRLPGEQGWGAARLNDWGAALLGTANAPTVVEERLIVEANFSVFVPPLTPPLPRFQLSRIAQWESHGAYEIYRLTRERLYQALDQGIAIEELLAFLERWSADLLPQNVSYTLREWAAGREALRLAPALLLEADDPLLLEQLRRDRRVALPPLKQLGERHWALAEADGRRLAEGLQRAGYGVVAELSPQEEPLSERDLTQLLCYAEVVAQLATQIGLDHGPSQALRRRLQRRLPSAALATARRDAAALLSTITQHFQEKEREP